MGLEGRRLDIHGPIGALVQGAATRPLFAPVVKRVMPHLDRGLSRLTRGRFVLSQLLVPTLVLTSTGAKSGLVRTTPLATLPDADGSFFVVGSNFGGGTHPGWSANLLKSPTATVVFRGRSVEVDAHLLDEHEKSTVWPRLREVWPVYDDYVAKSGRDLRVFRLVPRPPQADSQA